MVRLAKFAVLPIVLSLLTASWSEAQNQRQSRGRRGGFRGFTKVTLAAVEQVQKELKCTAEQKQQLVKIASTYRAELRGLSNDVQATSKAERDKKQAEQQQQRQKVVSDAEKNVAAVLNDDQVKRLNQITIQQRGLQALLDKKIATDLNLSQAQQGRIRRAITQQQEKRSKLFEGLRDLSREERRKKFAELRPKSDEIRKQAEKSALIALTTAQKEKFEQLKGKKFELDRSALFRRRNR